MKKLLLYLIVFGFVSLNTVYAETQHTETENSSGTRKTNEFPEYDKLATKFESLVGKNRVGKRIESIDVEKKNFVVQLSKSETEEAVKLVKRLKWYREALVSCENTDASTKVLGSVLDECIAPGILSKAVQAAVEKEAGWEVTLSQSELISCQLRLKNYYKEKLSTETESSFKFAVDKEVSEKLASLFKLFTPSQAEIKLADDKIATELLESLKKMNKENLCEVGVTKPNDKKVANVEPVLPKTPPAIKPNQNPPTSLIQKQPEAEKKQEVLASKEGFASPKEGYSAPKEGYKIPEGGYVAPKGGYVPPRGGYVPPEEGYSSGYGFNPARYMRQHYNKDDYRPNYPNQQSYPYYQRQDNDPIVNNPNPQYYPRQQTQPPSYPPFFMPYVPSLPPPPPIIISGGFSIVPTPIPTSSPCLSGSCQSLPCLSAQCMNRPTPIGLPNTCLPLNLGYPNMGTGNLNCPRTPPNVGFPPNINFPPNVGLPPPTGIPTQPIFPGNPNVVPQTQPININPTRFQIPRGTVRGR